MFINFIGPAISLIDIVVRDENRTFDVIASALGIVGDLFSKFGSQIKDSFPTQCIQNLIQIAHPIQHDKIQQNLSWAIKNLQNLQ